jgi:ribosomal protein L37E
MTSTHTHCLRCGRALKSDKSVATGYGPTCTRKVKAAAKAKVIAAHKPTLVAKAEELIEQGGIIPIRARRVFAVISSDGSTTYKTAPQGCTCPAGIKGRFVCYHRIAAEIVAAA